jgi:HAE1 family hydrophobic/amphiphilic exporter-1
VSLFGPDLPQHRRPAARWSSPSYSPNGTYDSLFLGNYSVININDALYRVNGVGQVLNFGLSEYAMRVWVNPDRLARLGLTVPDLARALQQQSTVNPSGRIGAEPAPQGQQLTYTVRAQGRLVTPEEFGNVWSASRPTVTRCGSATWPASSWER